MRPMPSARVLVIVAVIAGTTAAAEGAHVRLSIAEIAQAADLIFVGTVLGQSTRANDLGTMIFTDVVFSDVQIVHATSRSRQRQNAAITLTYAGGRVGNVVVEASDTPAFDTGRRYVVFMSDDGRRYVNPLVGGPQGLFQVAGAGTLQDIVLDAGGRAVVGLQEGRLLTAAAAPLVAASGQAPQSAAVGPMGRPAGPPAASDGSASYTEGAAPVSPEARPLTLTAFLERILTDALRTPVGRSRLRTGNGGLLYRRLGAEMQGEPIVTTRPSLRRRVPQPGANAALVPGSATQPTPDAPPGGAASPEGASLYYCGQQGPPLVMEQVAESWWEWGINNASMFVWNQVMDVFRYTDDDGSFTFMNWPSQESEFVGYPSSSDMDAVYGAGWGPGDLAITWTWTFFDCGSIQESDIAWNPAYSWTDDFEFSLGNPDVVLQRPLTMHELGHAWGMQRANGETYDYDEASVMHAYSHDIVEDGWGLHVADAFLFRRNYSGDRRILGRRDIGVESYFASGGLNNATTNAAFYRPGDPITLSNVLVENNTYTALANVRVRFYLSADKNITSSDYQLGGTTYWFWDSFCGECYNVGTYSTSVPTDVPPGNYYVGAIVTIQGDLEDDLTWNNRTFLARPVTITCLGTYSIAPTTQTVGAGGGVVAATVSTFGTCAWSAADDSDWITPVTPGGTGPGPLLYSVTANLGPPRVGHIFLPGATLTVMQITGCLATPSFPIGPWESQNRALANVDCLSPRRLLPGGYRPYADRYTLAGTAGQRLAIRLTTTAFDPYLYLEGPGGSLVAEDDDGGGGLDSRIPAGTGYFTLPSTGTYIIEVTSFREASFGSYALSVLGEIGVSVAPSPVTGCMEATGTITLGSPAPSGGLVVDLSDSLAAALTPFSTLVPAGASGRGFPIPTVPVGTLQSGIVSAGVGGALGVNASAPLSIRPISVATLKINPNPVVGPAFANGTVTLECPAPPGGIDVRLSSSNRAVARPTAGSLFIPPGLTMGTFVVATSDVSTSSTATIRARANDRGKKKVLTVQ